MEGGNVWVVVGEVSGEEEEQVDETNVSLVVKGTSKLNKINPAINVITIRQNTCTFNFMCVYK